MAIIKEIEKCRNTRSKVLYLQIAPDESVPAALCELTWLESLELYIEDSPAATLPKDIGKLTRLKELYVTGGEFDSLPESICALKALTRMEITCSLLRILPDNIGQLKNLTHVSFYATQLEEIPKSIGGLQSLKELSLDCCQLTALPASMGKLSKLESIQLTENHLTVLPEEFGNLQQLKELYLASNELTEVPPCIKKLKALTIAVLNNNRITSIPHWLDNDICGLTEEHIKLLSLDRFEELHYRKGFKLYENLLDIFPVLNNGQENYPDLDQKALQVYDIAVLNQSILSNRQRSIVEKFLNYYFLPENEEISYVVEKYSGIERRLSKKEAATLLQKLLLEEPIKITADEKETIVFFWGRAGYGYWKHVNYDLFSDYLCNYRTKEVASYSYWSSCNPSILCFDVASTFGIHRHITRCPVCTSDITVVNRTIPSSSGAKFEEMASMPYIETRLYVCPVCRWWAVSELLQDCEANGMAEAVFTCGLKTDEADLEGDIRRNILAMYNETSHPWSPVFRERQYWDKVEEMTLEEALWLFGE